MIIDQDFLRALQYGMPPTSQVSVSVSTVLVDAHDGQETFIQEVIVLPPDEAGEEDAAGHHQGLGQR